MESYNAMFYGRKSYLDQLKSLLEKKTASLVTCRGRRRIGKSTLIEQFAVRNGARLVVLDGLPPRKGMTNRIQLDNFADQLSAYADEPVGSVANWRQAFLALDGVIRDDGWTVVLLDEISWMGKYDADFAGYLKSAWDKCYKKHAHLVLVLCGSVSSWISDNILNSTGFVGRCSLDLVVNELTPSECLGFWGERADRTAISDIIDVLSVTGGVPRYLEEVKPELSAAENVRRMCFSRGGILFNDFRQIFNDIFGKSAVVKRKILEMLADGPKNLSEISQRLEVDSNGHLSRSMFELVSAGFVGEDEGVNPANGLIVREKRYRIRDNYTRFYLKFIEPRARAVRAGRADFISLEEMKGWDSVAGLQFETFVLNNLDSLLRYVGLNGALVTSAAPYRNNRESRGGGCQIDLLIQTRKSVCVVEIKRRERIDDSVVEDVREKVRRLPVKAGMSVRTALVYAGKLAPAVREDGYFDFIVPVEELFE